MNRPIDTIGPMIYRIDVRPKGADSTGIAVGQQIADMGLPSGPVASSRVFLIDTECSLQQVQRIAGELLADTIVETADVTTSAVQAPAGRRIEVHLKPGVMDPVAASTEMAIRDMGLDVRQVRTGRAFVLAQTLARPQLENIARRVLANGVIESVHFDTFLPRSFESGHEGAFSLRRVEVRKLNDETLKKLSREGHLFLSLTEMKAIQKYFNSQGREPTDIELETIAQTWSEHCVHKTLKSAVEVVDEEGRVLRKYDNLIKDTIFKSTMDLMARPGQPFCLSVFKDNAGVVVFDDDDAVCFKVETHNHPSAIEPYGGSATGAGGCIRDVMGTGLSARPIANTDIFCVAYPNRAETLPKGVIHPKRVLQQVVAGVRDYGNRMGIPTVNGAVYFDDRYLGNPLVFCGCVGLIPRDKINKSAGDGDCIVVMGGRTGRDGIHGATFSSAELTDTHADEFSHAVQIGNAITQKKMMDVILQARDRELFTGITDCGAGGLSSAVGEMGEKTGAFVELDKVPLKYAGLRYDEVWISEAQERMVMSVPKKHVDELLALSASEDVEATVIGHFGTMNRSLILAWKGEEVGLLGMDFLHDGIPMPTRRATVQVSALAPVSASSEANAPSDIKAKLLSLLAHPNIASKHWIIRQYDHEVQGGSVIKPLAGPLQVGPSDAAVLRPKLTSFKGVALGCGLAPAIEDPYQMTVAAIDEAIRNVVCVGAHPDRIAILDNFCWPSVDDERTMGTLVRACEACRDAARAYGIPFISGKDSLHNQFTNQETGQVLRIPNTLLISAMAVLEEVRRCVTMDLKCPDAGRVLLVSAEGDGLAGLATLHRAVAGTIATRKVRSCHDVSDGGWLVAVAEMALASGFGLKIDRRDAGPPFEERAGRYLMEVHADDVAGIVQCLSSQGANGVLLAEVQASPVIEFTGMSTVMEQNDGLRIDVAELTKAWRGTLDW